MDASEEEDGELQRLKSRCRELKRQNATLELELEVLRRELKEANEDRERMRKRLQILEAAVSFAGSSSSSSQDLIPVQQSLVAGSRITVAGTSGTLVPTSGELPDSSSRGRKADKEDRKERRRSSRSKSRERTRSLIVSKSELPSVPPKRESRLSIFEALKKKVTGSIEHDSIISPPKGPAQHRVHLSLNGEFFSSGASKEERMILSTMAKTVLAGSNDNKSITFVDSADGVRVPLIAAGTPERLVERLVYEHYPESCLEQYRKEFLITFRTFMSCVQFLEMLSARLRSALPLAADGEKQLAGWEKERAALICRRVLVVLFTWLNEYPIDFVGEEGQALLEIIETLAEEALQALPSSPEAARVQRAITRVRRAVGGLQRGSAISACVSLRPLLLPSFASGSSLSTLSTSPIGSSLSSSPPSIASRRSFESATSRISVSSDSPSPRECERPGHHQEVMRGRSSTPSRRQEVARGRSSTPSRRHAADIISPSTISGPPSPILPAAIAALDLTVLDLHPLEVARQLCLIEHSYLQRVQLSEWFAQAWTGPQKTTRAPNLIEWIARYNNAAALVTTEILTHTSVDKRTAALARWIQVGVQCRALQNFGSLMQIVSALQSAAISRLSQTWGLLSEQDKEAYEELMSVSDMQSNYQRLRSEINRSLQNPPCIIHLRAPYHVVILSYFCPSTHLDAAMILSDLTFIDDANANTTNQGLINFSKLRLIAEVLFKVQISQRNSYILEEVPIIQEFLVKTELMNDEQAYERSLQLEERKRRPDSAVICQSVSSPAAL